MSFKCGIIGLPNVGKSAFFNIITNSNVPSENFPFCTINPNLGIVSVFDSRLNKISKIVNSKKIIYANVEFVDIAGLVKNASKGEGLGNNFLSDIKNVDSILHIVRCFKNLDIIHIYDRINPLEDVEIINTELILSDLSLCEKILFKKKKMIKKNNNDNNHHIKLIEQCISKLSTGILLNRLNWSLEEFNLLKKYNLLTLKPMMYILNVSNNLKDNCFLDELIYFLKKTNSFFFLLYFNDLINNFNNKKFYLNKNNKINKKNSKNNSTLLNVISNVYKILNLETFFTVGEKESRAWTIYKNTNITQAANVIHSDFKSGFIRAKVISCNDFLEFLGEKRCKEFGKIRYEGKKYIVQDGDIINFLFKI